MIQDAEYKLAVQVYIWSDVDPKDSYAWPWSFSSPFFKDLIFLLVQQ